MDAGIYSVDSSKPRAFVCSVCANRCLSVSLNGSAAGCVFSLLFAPHTEHIAYARDVAGQHGTCPACRAQFANIRPLSYSEDGSSDGDYVPDDEDDDMDDEDDGFMDTDGFDAEADYDFDLHSDDDMDFDDVLQGIGLPAGFDMAADVEAFMQERAARRRAPAAATTAEEDIDAYLDGRVLFVDDPLPELPGPGPIVNVGFLPAPASLAREDSESEVLRDLATDDGPDVGGWEETADAGMENWGLSLSDEEASESLSEGELLRSMEDINPRNDGTPFLLYDTVLYAYVRLQPLSSQSPALPQLRSPEQSRNRSEQH